MNQPKIMQISDAEIEIWARASKSLNIDFSEIIGVDYFEDGEYLTE